jgi:hypothetical protein
MRKIDSGDYRRAIRDMPNMLKPASPRGNFILSVRFGAYHYQIERSWHGLIPFLWIERNPVHARGGDARRRAGWRWFEVYR